jgi:hypothetical protein
VAERRLLIYVYIQQIFIELYGVPGVGAPVCKILGEADEKVRFKAWPHGILAAWHDRNSQQPLVTQCV